MLRVDHMYVLHVPQQRGHAACRKFNCLRSFHTCANELLASRFEIAPEDAFLARKASPPWWTAVGVRLRVVSVRRAGARHTRLPRLGSTRHVRLALRDRVYAMR